MNCEIGPDNLPDELKKYCACDPLYYTDSDRIIYDDLYKMKKEYLFPPKCAIGCQNLSDLYKFDHEMKDCKLNVCVNDFEYNVSDNARAMAEKISQNCQSDDEYDDSDDSDDDKKDMNTVIIIIFGFFIVIFLLRIFT